MAKSDGYFGLRRGSTKSHTFQVSDGKQITKDRVGAPKNPRTLRQMNQRLLVATVSSAYRAMKAIADHSFEGKSAGMPSMREFMSLNMAQIQAAKNSNAGFFGFNKWGVKGLMPGSYIISNGSLYPICPDLAVKNISAAGKQIVIDVAAGNTVTDFAEEMGMQNFGDIATICFIFPLADGSYGFGAARFTYKQGDDLAGSFELAAAGDVVGASFAKTAQGLTLTVQTYQDWKNGTAEEDIYLAAICSRYVNGTWKRSKAQFDVSGATPTYAEAIATYPVGESRFLNGDGSVATAPSENPSSPSTPDSPGTTNGVLTISKTGTGTSTVRVDGSPVNSGATVEAGKSIAIHVEPAEGQVPTATLNGQSVTLTESDGAYEGTATMPAANATLVINSGSTGGGVDQN
ncbi:MAG: hypothetical protein J5770_00410 [Bacteroidaceae bacterium]|nr:hypothetical protein [Bacteroidaceae bacterium]